MILNTTQLSKLKQYYKHLSDGKTSTEAAALIGTARGTIYDWKNADNAPAAPTVSKKAPAPKKAAAPVKAKAPVKAVAKPVAKAPTSKAKPAAEKIEKLVGASPTDEIFNRLLSAIRVEMTWVDENSQISDTLDAQCISGFDEFNDVTRIIIETFGVVIAEELDDETTFASIVGSIEARLDAKAKNEALAEDEATDKLVTVQAIILTSTIQVVRDGRVLQIDKNHKNFLAIDKILKNRKPTGEIYQSDLEKLYDLIDMKTGLKKWSDGRIEVTEKGVMVEGKPLNGKLADIMLKSLEDGGDGIKRFAKFHEKIEQAISYKVTHRLFDFVSNSGLGIDEDGDILGVKVVRSNFLDKHSGTMDNSPGKTVEVKRNEVNDDDNQTCSFGLHVAAPAYIGHFGSRGGGDKVVLVKVDPRDFVSVPTDYSATKARVCKYKVLREVKDEKELNAIWDAAKTISG